MSDFIKAFSKEISLDTNYVGLGFGSVLSADEFEKLGVLRQLEYLSLRNAPVTNDLLEPISTLLLIQRLDLDCTDITDDGLAYLKNLPNLKELRLKDNPQLTQACTQHLSQIKSLEQLHLGNTFESIAGLSKLRMLPRLGELILEIGYDSYHSHLVRLSLKMPHCEILVKGWRSFRNGAYHRW